MNFRERQFIVESSQNKMRLDQFLTHKISRMSRTRAQRCIAAGAVHIEPRRFVKASMRVQTGDSIRLIQRLYEDEPQFASLRLIDENDDFWCFDKPAGMLVHPTARAYHNSVTVLVEKQWGQKPYVVHRLDRESSGLLLMAKNPVASSELGQLFLDCSVKKEYAALVFDPHAKHLEKKNRSLTYPLGYAGSVLPKLTMGRGKLPAQSDLSLLGYRFPISFLQLHPVTGRQHQLRVHLALFGTPILGDKLYFFGENFYKAWADNEPLPHYLPHRQLLHACSLNFTWRGCSYRFESTVPEEFLHTLNSGMNEAFFPTEFAMSFFEETAPGGQAINKLIGQ